MCLAPSAPERRLALPKETDAPFDVQLLRRELRAFLSTVAADGGTIGSHKYGVYAFYDYDGEPIYVGQTSESLATRIRRHLTNQRTDAVAMSVLDPFEVADVEAWPLMPAPGTDARKLKELLDGAEYTVFQSVLTRSRFHAVLNEGAIRPAAAVPLPQSYRRRIVPEEVFALRVHSDIRIARRAATIANLARIISERNPSGGLRIVLLTQARRLEHLTAARLNELAINPATYVPTDEDEEDLS